MGDLFISDHGHCTVVILSQSSLALLRVPWLFLPAPRILVAVSGGKDSLALWDILLRMGYQADLTRGPQLDLRSQRQKEW
jgi:hypothetical protein